MDKPHLPGFRPLLAAAVVAAAASSASALTLSGNLSDSTTGPIPAGVHHVVGSVTVPAGQTLTIQPGAILKFNNGLVLTLSGTLLAQGTAGQPIVFTSIADDVGGDTNGDGGASTPAPGAWRGIVVDGTATASVLAHCDIAYHGWGSWSGVFLNGDNAQLSIADSTIRDGSDHGIEANDRLADLSVTGCSFTGNANLAVSELRIEHCPGFVSNTASGNGGNHMRVTQPDPTADVTIEEQNCLEGALVFGTTCDVPAGVTLTLKAGVVVKLANGAAFDIDGTLTALGTGAKPVVVTSFADDAHGGDTNGDGPSTGTPGEIRGIVFAGGSIGNLDHAMIRYGGWGGWANVFLAGGGSQVTLTNSAIEYSADHGIEANSHLSVLNVVNCSFTGNALMAASELHIEHCEGFDNNTASGNGGNAMHVTQPDPTVDVTIEAKNVLEGALVFTTTCDVPIGVTLTLKEGVVVKVADGAAIDVNGALAMLGTAADPVVLTSFDDDGHGGDTNVDGPSNGAPGQIRGLVLAAGSVATVDHAVLRYGGWGGYANVYLQGAGAQLTMTDSTLSDCSKYGLDANGYPATLSVSGCSFVDNASAAAGALRIDEVPGFTDNTASGNGGNYIEVTQPDPSGDVTITTESCLGGALVFTTSCDVGTGTSLTFEDGVVVKVVDGATVHAAGGALHLAGAAESPVVLTSLLDDAVAGDTNGDGAATVPAPGRWQGIRIDGGAAASTLRHVLVRYPGWGGFYGLRSQSPLLVARYVRVEHAADYGFYVSDLDYGSDWVAWNGNNDGIRLDGGTFVLEKCTAANNAGTGIRDVGGFTGVVNGSLAFGNGTNIAGFASGELRHSNGDPTLAGTDGNIDADPLFVDAVNGDLTLMSGSPCIEAGDPLDFLQNGDLDLSGVPRILDGDFDKVPRVDMGAYEFDHVRLEVTGTFQPLGNVTFTSTGTPGLISYLFIGVERNKLLFYPYGTLLVDPLSTYVLVAWPGPPANPSFVVPVSVPTPQPISCQQIVFQGSTAGGGNLSNVESFVIEAP